LARNNPPKECGEGLSSLPALKILLNNNLTNLPLLNNLSEVLEGKITASIAFSKILTV
jgi:hypothetical protein